MKKGSKTTYVVLTIAWMTFLFCSQAVRAESPRNTLRSIEYHLSASGAEQNQEASEKLQEIRRIFDENSIEVRLSQIDEASYLANLNKAVSWAATMSTLEEYRSTLTWAMQNEIYLQLPEDASDKNIEDPKSRELRLQKKYEEKSLAAETENANYGYLLQGALDECDGVLGIRPEWQADSTLVSRFHSRIADFDKIGTVKKNRSRLIQAYPDVARLFAHLDTWMPKPANPHDPVIPAGLFRAF